MGRIYNNKNRIRYTNKINFYRRIHKNGLTSRQDTGMGSPLRSHYVKLSREKKDCGEKVVKEVVRIREQVEYPNKVRRKGA
jgi:hypothetical protein